jgi:phosphoribosyl-ATP pyrophosphohydrolase/phosphoribosyl-AMP cyclohydrolase
MIDLNELKFDDHGLIPAIVQDAENGEVLMMAWMNADAIEKTMETKRTHFFSRSRQKMWMKGESSGHVQVVHDVLYDCDSDCLLVKAEQKVAACHTGHRSCFYRSLSGQEVSEAVFDADDVYSGKEEREILDRLYAVIMERKKSGGEDSYTARLLARGPEGIGKKVLEEGMELTMAAQAGDRDQVISEAADLLYHAWVLLGAAEVRPEEVRAELVKRFGTSGLKEKESRQK